MSERAAEIDWNVELRKLVREYDGLPPERTPARVRAERALAAREKARESELAERIATWARVLLVALLASSLAFWPYGRACGWTLGGFVGACAMVAIGGLWAAARAWRARLALAHVLAVTLLTAGVALVTAETLPRFGYATLAWVNGSSWQCSASAVSAP